MSVTLLQCLLLLPLLPASLCCLAGFRYHRTDAATAKRKYVDKLEEDYYYDYSAEYSERGERRLSNATNCGRKGGLVTGATGHVVGGSVSRENELPWHVSMLRSHEGWAGCSATLISCNPVVVVTAAHCVE